MSKPIEAIHVIHENEFTRDWQRMPVIWTAKRRRFFQFKYTVGRLFGCLLLIAFSPAILVLWVMVKITSQGPGIYRQNRVGLDGKEFELFKLRSMRMDAEVNGQAVWCTKGDDRMTWLGRILRALHLDELPQLLNVARGEMSLVGPRPERPMICEKLAEQIEGYYDRVLVKPGITGLSQINLPPDTTMDDVRRKQLLDLQYINETTAFFELRILFATALRIVGIKGDTAMRWMRLSRRSLLLKMGFGPEQLNAEQPKPTNTAPKKKMHRRPAARRRPAETQPVYAMAYESDSDLDLGSDSVDTSSGVGLPR